MIPKIFHRIWLGKDKMPKEFEGYGETWQKLHPEWEMKLWTDNNLPELINKDYLSLCNTYSEKSDLIRYELLYKFGGIYIDVDFECFKNIDYLIRGSDIFASTEDNRHICGGFIGSVPKHPVIKNLIDLIPENLEKTIGKTSDLRIGPTFVTKNTHKDNITIFPKEYFYPYLPGQIREKNNLKNNNVAYAAHHWAASWLKKNEVSIIIPFRHPPIPDNGYRENNFDFVYHNFKTTFPEFEIVIGKDVSGEKVFCRSHSINDGIKNSSGKVVIISDGDIIIKKETVEKAIKMLDESPFIIPFGRCFDLSKLMTDRLLSGKYYSDEALQKNSTFVRDIRVGKSQWGDKLAGGIQIMTRELFDKVGGYDERFVGWGYEDTNFCKRIKKELGDYEVLEDEIIYHLWHPKEFANIAQNEKLYHELLEEDK